MAADNELDLQIVARFKDEAAAGLAALERRVAAFAAVAPRGATELARATDDLATRAQAAADRLTDAAADVKAAAATAASAASTAPPGAQGAASAAPATNDATSAIERYIAALAAQREGLRLTDAQRLEANALLRAEALAYSQGTTLREEDRAAISREVRATAELASQLREEAAAKAASTRQEAEETAARARGKAGLDALTRSIQEERQLVGLEAKEREVAIARRRAEALAIEAGITDRKQVIDLIERETRALQAERAAAAAAGATPRGNVGGAIGHALGVFGGGGGLGQVVAQAQSGAAAVEGLAAASGAAGASLSGLVAAGAGLGVVALGLGAAAREALGLRDALRQAVVLSQDAADRMSELTAQAAETAIRNAVPVAEVGAAISEAYQSGARSIEDATAITRAAADAQVLGFGSIAESVSRLDAVNDAFRLRMIGSAQVAREVFVAARDGEAPIGAFADALARAGGIAHEVGIPMRDTAAVLSVITRNQVEAGAASSGLSQLILKLSNPLDQTNQRLRGMGIETGRAAFEQKGLIGVLADLKRAVDQQPDLALELFGSPRVARAAFQAIEDGGRGALQTMRAMAESADVANRAIERGLNEPGERLARVWATIKANALGAGDVIVEAASRTIGVGAATALDIEPEEIKQAKLKLAQAIAANDNEAVRIISEGLKEQTKAALDSLRDVDSGETAEDAFADLQKRAEQARAGVIPNLRSIDLTFRELAGDSGGLAAYSEALRRAVPPTFEQRLAEIRKTLLATSDPLAILNEQLSLAGKSGVTSLEDLGKAVSETAANVPELRREFAELFSKVDAVKLRVEPQVEPEAVEAARKTIAELGTIPKEALSPIQSSRLQEATAVVTQYGEALRQAGDLGAKAAIDQASGLEREIIARAQARVAARAAIADLERQKINVDELKRAFAELDATQAEADSGAAAQKAATAQAAALSALAAEADARAKIARAAGDSEAADRAAAEALTLRENAAQLAASAAAATAEAQARGSGAVLEAVRRENEARREALELEQRLTREAVQRTISAREVEGARQVTEAQNELLQGYEAEIAKIGQAAQARRDKAREDEAAGKITASSLRELIALINQGEDLQLSQAFTEADLTIRDQLAGLRRDTARSSSEQAALDRELESIDRERVLHQLEITGATNEELDLARKLLGIKAADDDLRRKLVAAAGTDNLEDLTLRPRIQFEQGVLDAEIRKLSEPVLERLREALADPDINAEGVVRALRSAREEIDAVRASAEAAGESFSSSFVERIRDASRELGSSTANGIKLADGATSAFTNTLNDAFDALTGNAERGKRSVKDFVVAFARDLQQAINQILAFKAASSILNLFFAGGSAATNIPAGDVATNAAGFPIPPGGATGGVMGGPLLGTVSIPRSAIPAGLPHMPIHTYSMGGVASSPQLAIFGEGRQKEAFVPLPDGRRIPVDLRESSGGGARSVMVNFTFAPQMQTLDPRAGEEWLRGQARVVVDMIAERLEGLESTRLSEAIARSSR